MSSLEPFVVAAAQSTSVAGDIRENVARHLAFLRAAAGRHARLVVFPELSLTGYEPALARATAIHADDARLAPLKDFCVRHGLTAVVGAPLRSGGADDADGADGAIRIGALAFKPDGTVVRYAKQYLHPGEDAYFAPGSNDRDADSGSVDIDGETIALAICADTAHAAQAAVTGARLYAAGVLITANGYATDTAQLQQYAAQHRFAVLMANHGATTGGWSPAGKSACWDERGRCVVAAEGAGAALVLASRSRDSQNGDGWRGEVVALC